MNLPFFSRSKYQRAFIGDLGVMLCSLIWAISFSAVKGALAHFPPFWIITYRFALSLPILGLIMRKRIKSLCKQDWLGGLLIGGCFTGALISQAIGLQYTTTGVMAFLTAGYVALLPLMLWALGRRPSGVDFFSSLLCLAGMTLLTLPASGGVHFDLGTAWGISSACFAAGQVLSIEFLGNKSKALNLCFTQLVVGLVISFPAALYFNGAPTFPHAGWGSVGYLAFACTLIPLFLQPLAQPLTTPTRAALIYSLESVFAGLIGYFWLKEYLSSRAILGCVLIFAAVVISQLYNPKERPKEDTLPDLT